MGIPPEIQPLLDDYIALLEQHLPDLMGAMYLHGSIALGAFEPQTSDIDFVTVIKRPCTTQDSDTLTDIHHLLARKYPQWSMDGCYLQRDDLGKTRETIAAHPHVNEAVFHPSGYAGGNWVTWWLLKNHGVAAVGQDPKTLDLSTDWDKALPDLLHNMNTYWRSFIRDVRRIVWLWSDYGVQWTVTGVLRQFYTFRERAITSKVGAGDYGLACLPQRWHRIIREAIRIRHKTQPSLYCFRIRRMIDTFLFLSYIIRTCNTQFG